MRRSEVIALLSSHMSELRRFSVRSIDLFGSVARDEARPDSDVDVLVEFSPTPRLATFLDLKDYLEELLGRPVDVVTRAALPARTLAVVEADLVHVA